MGFVTTKMVRDIKAKKVEPKKEVKKPEPKKEGK